MSGLAATLILLWTFNQQWPYIILGMGYALGAAALVWVGEFISPYPHRRLFHATMGLILMFVLFGLILFNLSRVNLLPL